MSNKFVVAKVIMALRMFLTCFKKQPDTNSIELFQNQVSNIAKHLSTIKFNSFMMKFHYHIETSLLIWKANQWTGKGWSRADLRSVYQFWGHLIWASKFKKSRKRKTNVLNKNKKLSSVTLLSKLNIESKHISTVNRIKNYYSTLKILPLGTNHGNTSGWPLTWYKSESKLKF